MPPSPPISRPRPPWWWRASGRYPQAWYGWLRVGWRVAAVDLAAETATFARGVATA